MSITGIGEVANLATTVISRLFPDKTAQEQAQLAEALAEMQGQLDANKAEAASNSLFVAGWRPAVGWVCAVGFGVQFAIGPIVQWAATLISGHTVTLPAMDVATMMPLMLTLLGMGGMRSWEKGKGVANGH